MAFIQLLSFESLKWLLFSIISYFIYVYMLKPALHLVHLAIHYRSFPTSPNHFLLGHFNQIWTNFPFPYKLETLQRNFHEIFDKVAAYDRNQPLVVVWFTIFPVINVVKHEEVENVLNKTNLKKIYVHKYIELGDGLVTSEPAVWKVRRKLIQPFFSTKKLKAQIETMNKEVESFCQRLDSKVGKPVDLEHQIHSSTLNIILKLAASIPLDDSIEDKKELLELINELEPNSVKRGANPLYHFDWLFKFTEFGKSYNKTNQSISRLMYRMQDRRNNLLNSGSKEAEDPDFLDFLEDKVEDEGLQNELKTLIEAGHETIAVGLRWLFFSLGNHPEIQERLYQEIIHFFPDDTSVDDLDKINQCIYLDGCIKESLRLNPPVIGAPRTLEEDIMVNDKRLIKGTLVITTFGTIHRNPSIYPEPDKFDPDRWSPDKAHEIPKTAFIPFGHGPRSCIGYRYALTELKIYTIQTIRKFNIRSVRKHGSIASKFDIISKPVLPLEIILTPRNKT